MRIFVCVDDEGGMTFMGRRVTRDRIVTEDIAKSAGEGLAVFPYSERLFKDLGYSPRTLSSDEEAVGCDSLFIEDRSVKKFLDKVDTLIIYRWNRLYPSDKKIDFLPEEVGFSLIESVDIVGKSHEKITKEVFRR